MDFPEQEMYRSERYFLARAIPVKGTDYITVGPLTEEPNIKSYQGEVLQAIYWYIHPGKIWVIQSIYRRDGRQLGIAKNILEHPPIDDVLIEKPTAPLQYIIYINRMARSIGHPTKPASPRDIIMIAQ